MLTEVRHTGDTRASFISASCGKAPVGDELRCKCPMCMLQTRTTTSASDSVDPFRTPHLHARPTCTMALAARALNRAASVSTCSRRRCAGVPPQQHRTAPVPTCVIPSRRAFTSARPCAIGSIRSLHAVNVQQRQQQAVAGAPRLSRQGVVAQAAENEGLAAFDFERPETAREAIDLGLVLCKQEQWQQALGIFEQALSLPGTGLKRFRDKPPEASDSEKMAALYNIACCHSQLQDARSGLVALAGCLELGYADFDQIVVDPDLDFLRQDSRFQGLLDRFRPKSGLFNFDMNFLSVFGGGNNKK